MAARLTRLILALCLLAAPVLAGAAGPAWPDRVAAARVAPSAACVCPMASAAGACACAATDPQNQCGGDCQLQAAPAAPGLQALPPAPPQTEQPWSQAWDSPLLERPAAPPSLAGSAAPWRPPRPLYLITASLLI